MKTTRKWARRGAAILSAVGLCGTVHPPLPLWAADEPAAPRVVLTVTLAPYDRLAQFAKTIGMSLPPQATPASLEKMLGFMPPGSVAVDKPAQIIMLGSDAAPANDSAQMITSIPVTDQAPKPDFFTQIGAKAVEGKTDTVVLQGIPFRRTPDYLSFGGTTDALGAVAEKALAARYADDAGVLATLDLDIAAMRQAMPKKIDAFLAEMAAKDKDPGDKYVQNLFSDWVKNKLDRVALTAAGDAKEVRLKLNAEPLDLKPGAALARPAFPAGALARVDFAYPSRESAGWLAALMRKGYELNQAGEAAKAAGPAADPEALKRAAEGDANGKMFESLISHVTEQLTRADGLSAAYSAADGKPTWYQVNQYREDVDFKAGLDKVIAEIRAVAAKTNEVDPIRVESLTVAGGPASRVHVLDKGKEAVIFDYAQRGKTVYIAITASGGAALETLLAQKGEGNLDAVAEGYVDVGALVDSMKSGPGGLPLPEEARAELVKSLKGQKVSWSAVPAGKGAGLEVRVPAELLKQFVGLTMRMAQPDAAPPAAPAPEK